MLLGASNLTFNLSTLVGDLRRAAGGPVEVLAACGRGRSYGAWSHLAFVRHLPGIAGCGLWPALESRPPLPTVALVTDVGNDLGYGETPETIADWVELCLGRLAARRASTVCTVLPLARIERLSSASYYAARTLLFPGRTVTRPVLLERARLLDGHLRRLAREHAAPLIEPEVSWYGIDPIHPRRRHRQRIWDLVLAAWSLSPPTATPRTKVRLPLCGEEHMRLLRWTLHHPQPACRLADGTTVSLY